MQAGGYANSAAPAVRRKLFATGIWMKQLAEAIEARHARAGAGFRAGALPRLKRVLASLAADELRARMDTGIRRIEPIALEIMSTKAFTLP